MSNKIKVVHVISDTNIGGAGTHLLVYLRNYDRENFLAEVILPEDSRLIPEINKAGARCIEAKHIADRSFSLKGIASIKKILLEIKPDIVHTHGSFSARKAARLAGNAKIICTRHSVFVPGAKDKFIIFKLFARLINNIFADEIIAVSPAAKKNLEDTGTDGKKITVIYNGIDEIERLSDKDKKEAKKRFDLPDDSFVVSTIGRLVEIKGHDYILDAAKIINREKNLGIIFVFAGDGPREVHLKTRIENEKISGVVMAGFLPDVTQLMNISDVILNASYGTEATGFSLLEGLCAGVPALASDFGGNPYVVSDNANGLIFAQKDGAAIADAVMRVYNDRRLLSKLSEGARLSYEKKFTSAEMIKKMEDVYYAHAKKRI